MRDFKVEYLITLFALSVLAALAWYYLYMMASYTPMSMNMENKNPMTMSMDGTNTINFLMMPMTGEWGINDFIVMFVMWLIMMIAMMLPSTFIFLNIFRMMRSNMKSVSSPIIEMLIITLSYFVVWAVFSLIACIFQYFLHNNGVVDMMGTFQNKFIAGILLIGAGLFQFSSLKNACLEKCRNPLSFIMGRKIRGYTDVTYLGLQHGIFCLGCCWLLMLLLFVNGVMNLLWVVAITAIVLIEKMLPFEQLSSRFLGFLLVGWGSYLIII